VRAGSVRTLRGDETVDLSEQQRVLGLEQLDPGDLGPAPGAGGRFLRGGDAEDDESDVVAGVVPHDLLHRGGPVQPLHLPAGVLDDDRCRLRRLAVAHGAPLRLPAARAHQWWWLLLFKEPQRR
jgi:hypothetical protein